ncbi:MAG: hypothetical protein NWF01_10430 [Candidatus Bathyarchaeota archaeon]|nr:hypothetical protein [Candidatus Bathyarchaeota archaeon]
MKRSLIASVLFFVLISSMFMPLFAQVQGTTYAEFHDLGSVLYDFGGTDGLGCASSLWVDGVVYLYPTTDCSGSIYVMYVGLIDIPDSGLIRYPHTFNNGVSWNDRVLSLKVQGFVTLFRDVNLQGPSLAFSSNAITHNGGTSWNLNPSLTGGQPAPQYWKTHSFLWYPFGLGTEYSGDSYNCMTFVHNGLVHGTSSDLLLIDAWKCTDLTQGSHDGSSYEYQPPLLSVAGKTSINLEGVVSNIVNNKFHVTTLSATGAMFYVYAIEPGGYSIFMELYISRGGGNANWKLFSPIAGGGFAADDNSWWLKQPGEYYNLLMNLNECPHYTTRTAYSDGTVQYSINVKGLLQFVCDHEYLIPGYSSSHQSTLNNLQIDKIAYNLESINLTGEYPAPSISSDISFLRLSYW